MRFPTVNVVLVAAGPAGWEARHAGQVLYWGPSLVRAVDEARLLAELLEPARVVIEGSGPSAPTSASRRVASGG
jgi:hypothetical protein